MCFTRGGRLAWSWCWWWSEYWAGAFTTMHIRQACAIAPLRKLRWRTPLLRMHVQQLKLNPNAPLRRRGPWPRPASTN